MTYQEIINNTQNAFDNGLVDALTYIENNKEEYVEKITDDFIYPDENIHGVLKKECVNNKEWYAFNRINPHKEISSEIIDRTVVKFSDYLDNLVETQNWTWDDILGNIVALYRSAREKNLLTITEQELNLKNKNSLKKFEKMYFA